MPALTLTVITPKSTTSHALPPQGSVLVGRGAECGIQLADNAVSARHALLHVDDPLCIEDIGSSNGLRVRTTEARDGTSKLVERFIATGETALVRTGDGILIGSTLLVVGEAEELPATSERGSQTMPVVCDDAMRRLHELLAIVARGAISVLVLGETGVGKELMAEAIHQRSPRAGMPLVRLNCAALSESLLESELFGHEAGAFTGANRAKPGLLEMAEGGTVFLDEVGDLPPSIQAKLLRVLAERKVLRVGGLHMRPIDVRFVAATNRDLENDVQAGRFRRDLYFRLSGMVLVVPPLRERKSEIAPLARKFMHEVSAALGLRRTPTLSRDAVFALMAHDWPGNVRELQNVIERAVLVCRGDVIAPAHLGLSNRLTVPPSGPDSEDGGDHSRDSGIRPLRIRDAGIERQRIVDALEHCGGNQTRAADMLGISRRTLLSRLDLYGLARPRKARVG